MSFFFFFCNLEELRTADVFQDIVLENRRTLFTALVRCNLLFPISKEVFGKPHRRRFDFSIYVGLSTPSESYDSILTCTGSDFTRFRRFPVNRRETDAEIRHGRGTRAKGPKLNVFETERIDRRRTVGAVSK